MQLQTTRRIDATPAVAGPRPVRALPEREPRPIQSGDNAGAARTRTPAEQAAILHLGAAAVDRAQSKQESDAADTAAAPEPRSAQPDDSKRLSGNERRAVDDLEQRDREVRGHEQTQRSAGGAYASGAQVDYQVGPDGRRYAVSASTSIDVAPVPNDPTATLHKMQVVQRAATAPSNPSGADRQVAAEASHQARQARAELAARRYGEAQEPQAAGARAQGDTPPGKVLAVRA